MAFTIKQIVGSTVEIIATAMRASIANSRFTAEVGTQAESLSFSNIRLRASKDYCGNHPYACPIRAVHVPHRHSKCLEGADWIAWNNMLNDALDTLNVSANVASSLCVIRKGALRRLEYSGHKLGNGIDSEWNRDSKEYGDYRGKPSPATVFPLDTPGEATYSRAAA